MLQSDLQHYFIMIAVYLTLMGLFKLYMLFQKKRNNGKKVSKVTIDKILKYSKNYNNIQEEQTVLPKELRYFKGINLN